MESQLRADAADVLAGVGRHWGWVLTFGIVNGAIEVFTALSHRAMRDRGWTILMGALSVVAGVVVLVYPGISLITLAVVLGVWLLVYGVMEIVLAFRLRSVGQAATRVAPAT
jgi:uncharacterized membrane protein HdeD (DUF308 family)